ncbi:MAG: hypothetical protein PHU62_10110 [Bacteroidales bacterium]|jgi:hypothetical protein|nr:hypothetical protein [Bacteroidales bacterium]MDD3152417.1 hypothetical protein [Bacteroidales bacterium]MDD3915144.1 hypothetical protein [Bacteroidales bacterium]MDD4634903.1 hypothetical protein [Bacteroidales bacterium]
MEYSFNQNKILKYVLGFITLIIIFITFSPLLNFGFVMGDDIEFYYHSNIKYWHNVSNCYASQTGRFYFLLVNWIYALPYQIDALWFYNLMRILPVILAMILFVWLIKRSTKDEYLWMLALLVFCACFQINGDASAVTAYPFYFTFDSVLILTSFHLLLSYFEKQKYWLLLLSAVVFAFASCFQEGMLFYYLVFFLLIIYRYNLKTLFKRNNFLKILKELLPYIFFGAVYLTIYFLYSKAHPSNYAGNQFVSDFSFSKSWKILSSLILHSLPLSAFCEYKFFLLDYTTSLKSEYSLWFYLQDASCLSYIKAALLAVVFYVVIAMQHRKRKLKMPLLMCLMGILLMILPHILLTLSNRNYALTPVFYISTYFSYFGAILLIISIIIWLINLTNNNILRKIIASLIAVVLGFTSLLIQYTNERISYDYKLSVNRFKVLDNFVETVNIQENDVLYLADFDTNPTYFGKGLTAQESATIKDYLIAKHEFNINGYDNYDDLYSRYSDSAKIVKLIFFNQAAKSEDAVISMVKSKGTDLPEHIGDLRTDTILVGYYSAYKHFGVSVLSDTLSALKIDKSKMSSIGSSCFANVKSFKHDTKAIFTINGTGIIPKTLNISNILHNDATAIGIGRYPENYESAYYKYWNHKIMSDVGWIKKIDELAKSKGETFDDRLTKTTRWMVYYVK